MNDSSGWDPSIRDISPCVGCAKYCEKVLQYYNVYDIFADAEFVFHTKHHQNCNQFMLVNLFSARIGFSVHVFHSPVESPCQQCGSVKE